MPKVPYEVNSRYVILGHSAKALFRLPCFCILLRGESHIDFRTKCVIMLGGGSYANDVLKMRKVIKSQSSELS